VEALTHFLAVGFVRESLHELLQQTENLRSLLEMDEAARQVFLRERAAADAPTTFQAALQQGVGDLESSVRELLGVLEQFESDPVVYTGQGDTVAVLAMLERLLNENGQA